MEIGTEQANLGSWRTFSVVGSVIILIALIVAVSSTYRIDTPMEVSMVRVANETGLPLQNVRINRIVFGDVPVNGVSGYQAMKPAYRYAALRLEVAGKKFEMIPEDYIGETPLGEGSFTYTIQRQYRNGEMYFTTQDATKDKNE